MVFLSGTTVHHCPPLSIVTTWWTFLEESPSPNGLAASRAEPFFASMGLWGDQTQTCPGMCWIGTKRTFIGGWPIKNCDFPWQTVSHNQMQNTQTASSMVPLSWTSLNILQRHHHATHSSCQVLTHTTPVWYRWDTNWSNATTGSSVGSLPARFQRPLVMTNSLRTWKWP